jgi:hypothetical protein
MNGATTPTRPPRITDGRSWRFPLPPHPIAAEQARIATRLVMAEWSMEDITDDALLVVVELVANVAKIREVFHLTLSYLQPWSYSRAASGA